jgi:hypothetical protein
LERQQKNQETMAKKLKVKKEHHLLLASGVF